MTGYGTTFMRSEATHDSYFQLSEFGHPNGDLLEFLLFSPLFRSASRVQAASDDWLLECRRMFQTSNQATKQLASLAATNLMMHEEVMRSIS
jgi:hypothetical protein